MDQDFEKALKLLDNQQYAQAEEVLEKYLSILPVSEHCEEALILHRANCLIRLSEALRKQKKEWANQIFLLEESIALMRRFDTHIVPEAERKNFCTEFFWKPYQNLGYAARKLRKFKLEERAYRGALRKANTVDEKCKSLAYGVWATLCQGEECDTQKAWNLVDQYDKLQKEENCSPHLQLKIETGRALLHIKGKDIKNARIAVANANHIGYPSRIARELTRLLTATDIPLDQIGQIIIQLDSKGPQQKQGNNYSFSPLPSFIADEHISESDLNTNSRSLSEVEFSTYVEKAAELDLTSRYEEMENLSRSILSGQMRDDGKKVDILLNLGRALFRQNKFKEALQIIGDSIQKAYLLKDAFRLIAALDSRVEALILYKEPAEALQTLSLAYQYLDEADVDNMSIECDLLHSKAMAYAELGWFNRAFRHLQAAMRIAQDFRLATPSLLLRSEFGLTVLRKVLSEGASQELMSKGCDYLRDVQYKFEGMGNIHLAFQAAIDAAHLYFFLSKAKNDKKGMKAAIATLQRQQDFQKARQFFNHSIRLTIAFNQVILNGLDNKLLVGRKKEFLDAQTITLDRATSILPQIANLWREKALIHISRARHELDTPVEATVLAAEAMEKAVDITRKILDKGGSAQFRAHLINSQNLLFESLGEVAFYALEGSEKKLPVIAERMFVLAQYLRAQDRADIIRDLSQDRPGLHDNNVIQILLGKIRLLNAWLDKWNVTNEINSYLQQEYREGTQVELNLDSLKQEIIQHYPEYQLLENREVLRGEIAKLKTDLDRLWMEEESRYLNRRLADWDRLFTLEDIRRRLEKGDVVVDYLVGPSKLYIAVVSPDEFQYFEVQQEGWPNLFQLVQEEEQALDHKARTRTIETVGDLEKCRIWLLPDKLLQYLNTSNVKRLYVVASGPIWSTPFGFLRIDGKFAQEIWEICYVPAARFAGREDVPESVGRAFAVGHPGHSNDLANVEREVNLVGSILDGEVCFHRDASPDFVLKALPRAEVVHIACHSHLDAINSLLTFFELEPDERHRDGRLFLYEIIQQQAGPRIVGLFSCQTASTSDVVSFPETLAYSFIGTGTKYVLASQGPVGDKVCLDFSQAFYQLISEGKEDPVTAFAMAQREMIKHFRSDSANRGIQLRDERLPEMNNFVLITASDAVRSEAIVHHKKVKAEIPEISLYRALLNKARQMTKEFPPCVQNMGPEAEYWNTMPKSKPSAEVIMDFLHLLERSKQGFLSMLAELNPPIEEIAGALQELSRIREHVKFHPAKEVEIRRIIGGLLFQADQFDLPTSEKLTFIESKVLMEPSPGIGDVEHLIFEAEVRRITEESLADTRSFSGAGFESIMTQLCSQIDVEQILSLEVKRNIKQKEKFAIDQSSEVAPRDAQSKLPNGAIIEQMEIVKDRRIGSLEMRADSEKDAKRLFAAQSSKDAKIIDIQCLDPGRKGILRVIGRRKGNWQIHWTAPCQVAIEYVLPIEVAVQFVSLG